MNITPCGCCDMKKNNHGDCYCDGDIQVEGTYYTPCACGKSKVCICLGVCVPFDCEWFISPCVCKYDNWHYSPCGWCRLERPTMDCCPLVLKGEYYTCCCCGKSEVCCCFGIIWPFNCEWFISPCICAEEKRNDFCRVCSWCLCCDTRKNYFVSCLYCRTYYKGRKHPVEGNTNDGSLNYYIKAKGLQHAQNIWLISNINCRIVETKITKDYTSIGPIRQQMNDECIENINKELIPRLGPDTTKMVHSYLRLN